MGRPSKAATALVKARQAPPEEADRSEPLDSAEVGALTARFQELKRQGFRYAADTAVELGDILLEGRKRLQGRYLRWLDERLGIERATAANYAALARLSRDSPATIERFKELGVSKLYKIARLPPEGRSAVLRNPEVRALTDGEFHTLTAPWLPRRRKVTGNMRGHGLRMKVEASTDMLRAAKLPRVADPALREALKQALAGLAAAARQLAERIR